MTPIQKKSWPRWQRHPFAFEIKRRASGGCQVFLIYQNIIIRSKRYSGQRDYAPNISYFYYLKKHKMEVKDSNGNILQDGDSVTVIKDLKVRGSSNVIKRGTMVKNIRLTGDPAEIDGRVNKTAMVLRTEFVKKA